MKENSIGDRSEEKYDKDTHTLQNQLDIANADKINNYICKSEIKYKNIEAFNVKEIIKKSFEIVESEE